MDGKNMNSLIRLFAIMTVGFVALSPVGAKGAEASRPVVLMLLIESEALGPLQEAVKSELAMELTTHTLLTRSLHRFTSESLSAKIEEIRQIARANQAEVVIWLEKTKEDAVSLQLVAAAPGRSMLRSVSAQLSGDTAGELSIAARQLLEEVQIDLKEESASRRYAPSPGVPHDPTPRAQARSRQSQLGVAVVTTGGFNGTSQIPILLGGTLSLGFNWEKGLTAELTLTVFSSPVTEIAGGNRNTVGIRPGIGIGYLWQSQVVSVGPYLGLQAPWQTARVSLGDNPATKDSWWNFRVVPSIDLRFRLHRNVMVSLRPGLGILAHRVVFERVFDGEDIHVSPYLEWNIVCAAIIVF